MSGNWSLFFLSSLVTKWNVFFRFFNKFSVLRVTQVDQYEKIRKDGGDDE